MDNKSKGLPDGSNMFLEKLSMGIYLIWRQLDDKIIWLAQTDYSAIAEYLYCFED